MNEHEEWLVQHLGAAIAARLSDLVGSEFYKAILPHIGESGDRIQRASDAAAKVALWGLKEWKNDT